MRGTGGLNALIFYKPILSDLFVYNCCAALDAFSLNSLSLAP